MQLRFDSDDIVVATRIVRAGDSIVPPANPTATEPGMTFHHWGIGLFDMTSYLNRPLTDDDIRAILEASDNETEHDGLYDVPIYAIFDDARLIRFHEYPFEECLADPAKAAIFCSTAFTTLTDGVHSFDTAKVSDEYVPIAVGADVRLTAWERYADGATTGATPQVSYEAGEVIEDVSAPMDLYPHLATGFWTTFDTGDAPKAASVFVKDDGDGTGYLPQDALPSITYKGYELDGWYATRTIDDEGAYIYKDKVTDGITIMGDTTLYAKWNVALSPLKVVTWVEGSQGKPGEGAYTYNATQTLQAYTGSTVNAVISSDKFSIQGATTSPTLGIRNYYSINTKGDKSVVVESDGTTVMNLYFNRNYYDYHFRRDKNSADVYHTIYKWGQFIADDLGNSPYSLYYRTYNNWHYSLNGGIVNSGLSGHISKFVEMPLIDGAGKGSAYRVWPQGREDSAILEFYRECSPGEEPQKVVTDSSGTSYNMRLFSPTGMASSINLFHDNYTGYHVFRYNCSGGPAYIGDSDNGAARRKTTTVYDVNNNMKTGVQVFYKLKTYDLSFDARGGTAVPTAKVKHNYPVADYMPMSSALHNKGVYGEDLTFAGWFESESAADDPEANADMVFDPEGIVMPAGNMVLYAGWNEPTYTVSFDVHGGTEVGPQEGLEPGSLVALPEQPTKKVGSMDYTFVGWYKDAELKEPWNFQTDIVTNSDITLHAKWVRGGNYTVAYHTSDGTQMEGVDDTVYRYGATVTVAPAQDDPLREQEGMRFLGWSRVKGNESRIVGQSFVISSNTDLFAIYGEHLPDSLPTDYEAGAPTVTLTSNYASLPEGIMPLTDEVATVLQATRANATVNLPTQLTGTTGVDGSGTVTAAVQGYRLVGWNTESEGTGVTYALGAPVAVASDTTLYAQWEPNRLVADGVPATATYAGVPLEPLPAVHDLTDDSTLIRGEDYEIAWASNTNVGTATVRVTGKGDYAYADPVTLSFVIQPAPIRIEADDKSTPFAEPVAELTWHVEEGAIFGEDDLGIALSCEVTTETGAGKYPIHISAAGNPNYAITLADATYTVVPNTEVAVEATGYVGTYDGAAHGITVTPALRGSTTATIYYAHEELSADTCTTRGTTDASAAGATAKDAGATTIYWWIEAHGDQEASKGGSATVAITPAALTVTARPATAIYGAEPANDGVTCTGFVGGEDESALGMDGLSYTYKTRADGSGSAYTTTSPRGTYYIIPSGVATTNYQITYVAGTLTVAPRELTLVWSDANPVYTGATRHYAGATLEGVVEADKGSVLIGGYSGTISATDVGDYTTNVASLTGDAARNYVLPSDNTHTWKITQASNSATVAIDGWTYGDDPNEPLATAGFGEDLAHYTYSTSPTGDFTPDIPITRSTPLPPAGDYFVKASIDETPNYEGAVSPPTRFAIASRDLTATANDVRVTYGDDVPTYDITFEGFAPGEDQTTGSVTGDIAFDCSYTRGAHAGSYEIRPYGIEANANYSLTLREGTLYVMQATNSWVVPPAVSDKTYDGSPVEFTMPEAAFAGEGEPVVEFARAGTDSWSTTAPTDAGRYVMRSSVEGNDDYTGLLESLEFQIERATWPDIPVDDVSVVESQVTRPSAAASPVDARSGSLAVAGHDGSMPAEYSMDGGTTWNDLDASGSLTGLAAGNVALRHKADANHIESATTTVEVMYGVAGSVRWNYHYLYPVKNPDTGETTMVEGVVNDTGTERSRAANLYLYAGGASEPLEGYPTPLASSPDGEDAAVAAYEVHGLSVHQSYSFVLRPTVDESPDSSVQVESASYSVTQAGDDFAVSFTPATGFFDGEWEIHLTGADTDGHTDVQALYVAVYWAPDDLSPTEEYAIVSQQAGGPGERCVVTGTGADRVATGSLPVWLYNSTGIPSRYRAKVVGIVVDGVEYPCNQDLMSAGAPSPMHWDDSVMQPVNAPMTITVDNLNVPMVALDPNGGTIPTAEGYLLADKSTSGSYDVGRSLIESREPSWAGHDFAGWYASASPLATDAVAADITGITSKVVLYAHWTQAQEAPLGLAATHPSPVCEGANGNVVVDGSGVAVTNADASITGVDSRMEWRAQASDGTWPDTWQPVPEGAATIDNLAVGTYQVRMAAVDAAADSWAKNPSEPAQVSVTPSPVAETPDAPTIVSVEPTRLEVAVVEGQAYSIDGGVTWLTPDEGATTMVFEGLTPNSTQTVMTRRADTELAYHSNASAPASVTLPKLDMVVHELPHPRELVYDGNLHALVDPPSVLPEGCVGIRYRIAGEEWQEDVPTASSAIDYLVEALYIGDDTHLDAEVQVSVIIAQAPNRWETQPSISGWVAGSEPGEPSGQARFGEVTFAYRYVGDAPVSQEGESDADDDGFVDEVPSAPGSYVMRASVDETPDYEGIVKLVEFRVDYDTIAYRANFEGASGSTPPTCGSIGETVKVAACGFETASHDFVSWNSQADGGGSTFLPGSDYVLTEGVDELYAMWTIKTLTVRFDTGAGTPIPSQRVTYGQRAEVPAEPHLTGRTFGGWVDAKTGRAYDFDTPVTQDMVLRAVWGGSHVMYRLYNPNSGEHFYTASSAERDAVAAVGWSYEGIAWLAPSDGQPVYRLYNPNAGDHHYTMSEAERNALVEVGWSFEGIGWFSDVTRSVPVWRQYNPNATCGSHNFTTSEGEHLALCALGWRGEGVAWFGL